MLNGREHAEIFIAHLVGEGCPFAVRCAFTSISDAMLLATSWRKPLVLDLAVTKVWELPDNCAND